MCCKGEKRNLYEKANKKQPFRAALQYAPCANEVAHVIATEITAVVLAYIIVLHLIGAARGFDENAGRIAFSAPLSRTDVHTDVGAVAHAVV